VGLGQYMDPALVDHPKAFFSLEENTKVLLVWGSGNIWILHSLIIPKPPVPDVMSGFESYERL